MAIYHFDPSSLLGDIRVVRNSTGGLRAYLHANPAATPEQLAAVQEYFARQNMTTVPYNEGGKASLEVRGFDDAEAFVASLTRQGWTQGAPEVTPMKEDKPTRAERLRAATLRFTGLTYNVGDIAYMTYAFMSHHHADNVAKKVMTLTEQDILHKTGALEDKHVQKLVGEIKGDLDKPKLLDAAKEMIAAAKLNIIAGIGYAFGGLTLSFFGSKDQSQNEIKTATKKAQQFMAREGVSLPEESAMQQTVNPENVGPATKLKHFFSRYPSEILNVVYTGVGLFLAGHAYKGYKVTKDKAELWDIGLGAVTTTSSLAGILIKEKKPIEGQPKRHGLAGVWDWIQEKPLRATGYGFMIATAFHAKSSYIKYKEGDAVARKTVLPRIVFVASNVVAEVLLAISSKGHGVGVKADNSVEKTVLANAAEVIALQPPEQQEVLVQRLAGYMATSNVLAGKADVIAAELHEQLKAVKSNPWSRHHVAAPVPATVAPTRDTNLPSPKIDAATLTAERLPQHALESMQSSPQHS